ncbi:hypothetical protein BC938DRAFT_476503, partial [Jimgerdemannia flammicorona]
PPNPETGTPGQSTRVVSPPLLSKKITVSAASNTAKWIFVGTRPEIISWMREHPHIVIENTIFADRPTSYHTHTELVVDLLAFQDPEQTTYDYVKSYFVTDSKHEKVKVEIRPKVDKVDYNVFTLCRIILSTGICFGEIVDDLERQWAKPGPTYYEQMVNLYNDKPGPEVILSSDVPMAIVVDESAKLMAGSSADVSREQHLR